MQSSTTATLDRRSDLATGIRSATQRETAVIFRYLENNVSIAALDVAKVFRGLDDEIANITNMILQEEGDHCEGGDHFSSYASSKSSFTPSSSLTDLSQSSLRSLNDNEGSYLFSLLDTSNILFCCVLCQLDFFSCFI